MSRIIIMISFNCDSLANIKLLAYDIVDISCAYLDKYYYSCVLIKSIYKYMCTHIHNILIPSYIEEALKSEKL